MRQLSDWENELLRNLKISLEETLHRKCDVNEPVNRMLAVIDEIRDSKEFLGDKFSSLLVTLDAENATLEGDARRSDPIMHQIVREIKEIVAKVLPDEDERSLDGSRRQLNEIEKELLNDLRREIDKALKGKRHLRSPLDLMIKVNSQIPDSEHLLGIEFGLLTGSLVAESAMFKGLSNDGSPVAIRQLIRARELIDKILPDIGQSTF